MFHSSLHQFLTDQQTLHYTAGTTPSYFFLQITPKTTFSPAHAFGECCASLKIGKKTGQKLVIFQPNFHPQTTISCGQALLFLLFSTILHHYYTLNVLRTLEIVTIIRIPDYRPAYSCLSAPLIGNIRCLLAVTSVSYG